MAARAIASATVSFGLVSIPIKLYSSKNSGVGISFNMLHDECHSRLKQQYTCKKCEKIVEREDRVKGYEFSKGQYVIFTDEEVKAVQAEATKTIAISEFVPLKAIDPVFFDKPYYLGPDKGGSRAYALLSRALRQSNLCGIAKYAARGKQYLVMLRPIGEAGLVMQQLLYDDEVRGLDEVPIEEAAEIQDAELELAMQLINQTKNAAFEPEKYSDDVRARLEEIIEAKVQGQEVTISPAEEPKAQVIDLMAALKASLSGEAPEPATSSAKKTAKKAPAKKKKAKKKAAKKKAKG